MQPFGSMDVYRMNEENVNWIAGSLNFPGIIGSQMTLLLSILTLTLVGMAICLIGILFCASFLLLVGATYGFRNPHLDSRVHVMAIAGSGGHTSEILRLLSGLNANRYYPRSYVVAATDTTSEAKIEAFEAASNEGRDATSSGENIADFERASVNSSRGSYRILKIPRSREVGQSWFSTVFTSVSSCLYAVPLVVDSHPDLVICNGPGTCIPICLIVRFIRLFRIIETKIVFVESICRVKSLSLSGKILYHLQLADGLVVQWPELKAAYPRTELLERIV